MSLNYVKPMVVHWQRSLPRATNRAAPLEESLELLMLVRYLATVATTGLTETDGTDRVVGNHHGSREPDRIANPYHSFSGSGKTKQRTNKNARI